MQRRSDRLIISNNFYTTVMIPIPRSLSRIARNAFSVTIVLAAACKSSDVTSGSKSGNFTSNPCSPSGTLTIPVATSARIDCSGGGTTLTLAGNGASYLIVPQFATDAVPVALQSYQMTAGTIAGSAAAALRIRASGISQLALDAPGASAGLLPPRRNLAAQHRAERVLRERAAARGRSLLMSPSFSARSSSVQAAVLAPPALGSMRSFHVASSFTSNSYATVNAQLAYVGQNVLVYIDSLAPANGFTPTQITAFGALFDQTLYPIDTAAFGSPSDLDNNGRAIMLMSPIVNADTPKSACANGFVAGFFDPGDFDGPSDPNSNHGEIFYAVVPDPNATFSCALKVTDVDFTVPATFMHELQHLINFSQHVVISGGALGSSWLDEGLSIVAEELGSLYYEKKCPPPQCRTNVTQLFPDSSQGFIQDFLYDSYQYAYVPDTTTITLSTDDQDGFAWRGGAWLFARYLGDQYGSTIFRQLERGPANAITAVQSVSGQSFQTLFANFGIALYTDSLPFMARNTAPAVNRFTTRNMKALWARLFATSGPSASIPFEVPIRLFSVTTDTSKLVMLPGTMAYFRLDTPATSATVTIRFSGPGGAAFLPALKSQMAIFRLPPGQ